MINEQIRIDSEFLENNNIIDYSLLAGIHWLDYELDTPRNKNDKNNIHFSTVSPKHKRLLFGTVDNNIQSNKNNKLEYKENNISKSSISKIIDAKSDGNIKKTNFILDSELSSVQSAYNIDIDILEISNRSNDRNLKCITEFNEIPLYDVMII